MNSFPELLKSALNKMSQQIEFQTTARKDPNVLLNLQLNLLSEHKNWKIYGFMKSVFFKEKKNNTKAFSICIGAKLGGSGGSAAPAVFLVS